MASLGLVPKLRSLLHGKPCAPVLLLHSIVWPGPALSRVALHAAARAARAAQSLGIPHQVEILVERAEDSAAGIGSAICKHVAELEVCGNGWGWGIGSGAWVKLGPNAC